MSSAFQKFQPFSLALAKGAHNLSTAAFKLALCASANAPVATNAKLSDLTEISYTNHGSRSLTTTSVIDTAGSTVVILADLPFVCTGAAASFRYACLYDDSDTATPKGLIAFWDYGSDIPFANAGDNVTFDFDNVLGAFDIT